MGKSKEVPLGFIIDNEIEKTIKNHLVDELLSCSDANKIAMQYDVSPDTIGHTVDALNIRLTRCQLGLFGYLNKKGWEAAGVTKLPIPEEFVNALKAAAGDAKKITCLELWNLAEVYKLTRMHAGYLADSQDIQIRNCQIGAF